MKVLMLLFIIVVTIGVLKAENPRCLEPVEAGRCLAYNKRYAYSREGGCQEFIYGGCGGNDNNFATYEDCQKACLIPR